MSDFDATVHHVERRGEDDRVDHLEKNLNFRHRIGRNFASNILFHDEAQD